MGPTLRLEGEVGDLDVLEDHALLTSLRLEDCSGVSDLGSLARLTQLAELDLRVCLRVSDLSPLAGLTGSPV